MIRMLAMLFAVGIASDSQPAIISYKYASRIKIPQNEFCPHLLLLLAIILIWIPSDPMIRIRIRPKNTPKHPKIHSCCFFGNDFCWEPF